MNFGMLDGFFDAHGCEMVRSACPGNFTVIPWCVHTTSDDLHGKE